MVVWVVSVYMGAKIIFEDEFPTEVSAVAFAKRVIAEGIRIIDGELQTFLPPHAITKVEILEA